MSLMNMWILPRRRNLLLQRWAFSGRDSLERVARETATESKQPAKTFQLVGWQQAAWRPGGFGSGRETLRPTPTSKSRTKPAKLNAQALSTVVSALCVWPERPIGITQWNSRVPTPSPRFIVSSDELLFKEKRLSAMPGGNDSARQNTSGRLLFSEYCVKKDTAFPVVPQCFSI